MNRPLIESSAFLRAAKRILKRRPELIPVVNETLLALESDAFDPRLRTHKLQGDLRGYWSCSVEYDLRIVFEFVQDQGLEAILLASIGSHDEVY